MKEADLIRFLQQSRMPQPRELLLGIGDDCSLVRAGRKKILLTVDGLVQGVHFKPAWGTWAGWGNKLAQVNLSDIAAMGGTPRLAWLALNLPRNFPEKNIRRFLRGLLQSLRKEKTALAGGNITRDKNFSAHLFLWGEAGARAMTRGSARPGEGLFLVGALRPGAVRPTAQIKMGQWLARHGCRCAIDVSDGLLKDALHLAKASGVRLLIAADRIPRLNLSLSKALTGGENYNLLFTHRSPAVLKKAPLPCLEIGAVKKGAAKVEVTGPGGRLLKFKTLGYDHL